MQIICTFAIPKVRAKRKLMSDNQYTTLKTNKKIFGTLCGIGAAVCYGTNPLGAQLYSEGMQPASVLFWRFGLAFVIIAIVMMFRKESLRINRREFYALTGLGLLFLASSLTLYMSFKLMALPYCSSIRSLRQA